MKRFFNMLIENIEWFLEGFSECCVKECCDSCYEEKKTIENAL